MVFVFLNAYKRPGNSSIIVRSAVLLVSNPEGSRREKSQPQEAGKIQVIQGLATLIFTKIYNIYTMWGPQDSVQLVYNYNN